jgi:hypothetical protein
MQNTEHAPNTHYTHTNQPTNERIHNHQTNLGIVPHVDRHTRVNNTHLVVPVGRQHQRLTGAQEYAHRAHAEQPIQLLQGTLWMCVVRVKHRV